MKTLKLTFLTAILAVLLSSLLQAATIAEIKDLQSGDLESVGFTLTKGADVDIDVVGIRTQFGDSRSMMAYAWIIDSKTREMVWEMESRRSDRTKRKSNVRQTKTTEHLDAGSYELYYSVRNRDYWSRNGGKNDFLDALSNMFDDDDDDNRVRRSDIGECFVNLSSDELQPSDIEKFEIDGGFSGALIRHTRLGHTEFIKTGFELSKPGNLKIYSLVEQQGRNEAPVDHAWIIEMDSRERVWEVSKWDADYAGGAEKNLLFNEEVAFEKGKYILYVVTDNSHSFEEFNGNPPYDPFNWGVTILPGAGFDKASFSKFEAPTRGEAVVELTRARNNDIYEQSFKLTKETKIQIYAIGEMANSRQEFVDYGSIIDASTGETVWEMTYRNTEHAGGASKNRMFDNFVTLPAGTYTAYYLTDDSHAFRRWNSSAPFEPDYYGLSIYATDKTNSVKLISERELTDDTNVLAKITRVGDGRA